MSVQNPAKENAKTSGTITEIFRTFLNDKKAISLLKDYQVMEFNLNSKNVKWRPLRKSGLTPKTTKVRVIR